MHPGSALRARETERDGNMGNLDRLLNSESIKGKQRKDSMTSAAVSNREEINKCIKNIRHAG